MRYLFPVVLISLLFLSCNSSNKKSLETHQYTNELIDETSPYLLQHAHNPVNWRGWNEKTLDKAKQENKLMIVSIGYAACHWCHVMERESFEDSTVAAVMNQHFISVKVDREERPDVDQIYINAVQLMTGSAGWPLNVITLPDGRPVWGGTYFKKEEWIAAINKIQEIYENEPAKLEEYAAKLEEGVKSMDLVTFNKDVVDFTSYDTKKVIEKWSAGFDHRYGGYKRAPKFMMPNNYHYLLREAVQTENEELLAFVTLTLDQMAYGGIYDQIGGGFSRYSVDERWHVPHFEKMLYDNAQLVSLYSDAFLVTKKALYKEVVQETLDYIQREMTTAEGTFYSSLDADSETVSGELEEGAYYIYTQAELKPLLKDDFTLFSEYYNINSFGKWEGDHYILLRNEDDATFASNFGLTTEAFQKKKETWKKTLSQFRNKRPKPRLDDKTLTSWNGLMLTAYVDAYKAFQKEEYLAAALKNAQFIASTQLQSSGALYHTYKDGKSSINGYLEDYAAVIEGYLALYEVTMDAVWLERSKRLADYTFSYFFDEEKHMFYFTSKEDAKLMTRTFEYRDNVIPASNSIMAKNLFKLSHYFDKPKYGETSKQMLKNVLPELEQYPSGFSNWMDLLRNYQSKYFEVVVVGPEAEEQIAALHTYYIPNMLIAGSTTQQDGYLLEGRFVEGETYIYVCVNNTCKLPVKEVEKAIETIKNF
ncbi:MAG: thioredoxin domain-containing protein [Altibacter sp.]|nr:thioredoxin domain-containing protein [Altibacter sp.]MCW9038381.1 thioredoxin domain-containing protein [Altibacter sp.]